MNNINKYELNVQVYSFSTRQKSSPIKYENFSHFLIKLQESHPLRI